MANGGTDRGTEGWMEGWTEEWIEGRMFGSSPPPPSSTRHLLFGAAAQKEIKLNGVSFKSQSGGSNPSLEAQIPVWRLKSQS